MSTQRIGEGDTSFTAEDVEELRTGLIELRDSALGAGIFEWAVQLSHTIAFMAVAKRELFK